MVKFYLTMIARGKITIDDVPEKWREEVQKALEEEKG
jgi:hypothetical protein